MLTKRFLSSVVLFAIMVMTLFVDWLCGLMVTAFIILGLYEFFTILENKGISIYKYFGILMGALIPLSIVFHFQLTRAWELFLIVLGMVSLMLMQFRRRESSGVIVSISTTMFGILYVSWFLSFLIKIRYLEGGLGLFLVVLAVTKAGDIGAYLIGTRFGRHPLMPRVSPKKSLEGAIGGLAFSILAALACAPVLKFSYPHVAFLGIFLGVLAQLGDLSESLMKRDCQVKDSGNILPGMGGVLDLADSVIFTAPAFYFYLNLVFNNVTV